MTIQASDLKACLADYVLAHAKTYPERIALASEYGEISYAQLGQRVIDLAHTFAAMGVQSGDRVAVLTTPRSDAYTVFLALNLLGATWVGINPVYQLPEMQYLVDDAQPVALLFLSQFQGRDYLPDAKQLLASSQSLKHIVCLDRAVPDEESLEQWVLKTRTRGESLADTFPARDPENVAMIVYTSGSTGQPKGCMLQNRATAYRAFTQLEQFKVAGYPRVYCPLPLNHVGGLQMVAATALFGAGTVNFREKFDPAEVGKIIAAQQINFIVLFPTMYQLICEQPAFYAEDFSSLECIVFSGGTISRELLEQLSQLGNGSVRTCFGSTETCLGVVFSDPDLDLETLAVSVGKPIRDDVRVVNEDGNECAVGEVGEFQVLGSCMKGYFNRPEATAAAFTEDGWLKSADLVEVLDDGNLRFTARVSDMFKSGGYNVYPREVEICIESHPKVVSAAVVGKPDELYGEVGHAYITATGNETLSSNDLKAWCKQHISNYKVPKFFEQVEAMPLLPNGKLDKTGLRKRAMAQ